MDDKTLKSQKHLSKDFKLNILIYVVLFIWSIFVLFPMFWALSSSFKPTSEIFRYNITWFPVVPSLQGYIDVFSDSKMVRYLLNTLFVASISTIAVIIVASMAGYAFSRYNLKGRRIGIMAVISVQLFPPIMFIVPYFILMRQFGIYNTYFALIITRVVFFIPFSTLMMKSFCDSIPKELEEAAIVDGCSQIMTFLRVITPLLVPAIATVTIFTFLNSWNEYLFSTTVVSRDSLRTITAGLSASIGQYGINWGQLMSLSVLSLIIPMTIFMAMQKYFIKGLVAGAVKG